MGVMICLGQGGLRCLSTSSLYLFQINEAVVIIINRIVMRQELVYPLAHRLCISFMETNDLGLIIMEAEIVQAGNIFWFINNRLWKSNSSWSLASEQKIILTLSFSCINYLFIIVRCQHLLTLKTPLRSVSPLTGKTARACYSLSINQHHNRR